jgi:hypothetical protein
MSRTKINDREFAGLQRQKISTSENVVVRPHTYGFQPQVQFKSPMYDLRSPTHVKGRLAINQLALVRLALMWGDRTVQTSEVSISGILQYPSSRFQQTQLK